MSRPNIRSYTNIDDYVYSHTRKIKKPSLYSKKPTGIVLEKLSIDLGYTPKNWNRSSRKHKKQFKKRHGKQHQIEMNKTLKKNAQ